MFKYCRILGNECEERTLGNGQCAHWNYEVRHISHFKINSFVKFRYIKKDNIFNDSIIEFMDKFLSPLSYPDVPDQ